eukprot:6469601-Amphidinium_carterae.3
MEAICTTGGGKAIVDGTGMATGSNLSCHNLARRFASQLPHTWAEHGRLACVATVATYMLQCNFHDLETNDPGCDSLQHVEKDEPTPTLSSARHCLPTGWWRPCPWWGWTSQQKSTNPLTLLMSDAHSSVVNVCKIHVKCQIRSTMSSRRLALVSHVFSSYLRTDCPPSQSVTIAIAALHRYKS